MITLNCHYHFENLVNIPIFRSILKTAIDAYPHTQSVQTSLSRGDTKSMLKFGQIPIGQYQSNIQYLITHYPNLGYS
jgi:hypothetical protein